MNPPTIIRRSLLEGAEAVSGSTVVIDTFRAFSAAAYLVDKGVDHAFSAGPTTRSVLAASAPVKVRPA